MSPLNNQVSLFGSSISLYALLAALLCLCAAAALPFIFRRHTLPAGRGVIYAVSAALLGLLLGRAVYCAVRTDLFMDPFGDSLGLSPAFDLSRGSISVIGVLAGVLLASLPASLRSGSPASRLLDAAVIPGLLLFAAMRFIEPLSGEGYGPLTELPFLCFTPLGIQNGWGGWSFSVCFLEGVLALITAAFMLRPKWNRTGSRVLCALVLLAACQIVPESLRRDNALFIFIFARVTQVGYAVILFACGAIAWHRGAVRGLSGKVIAAEAAAVLSGIVLLIGCEYALDKTDWSPVLIYAVMILILALLAFLLIRRIRTEDRAA